MNIFFLDNDPVVAAQYHCDKHVPKMIIETVQMMVSAARRHGATDSDVPTTQKGTPHKGGYHNHPCTVWVGDNYGNYRWCLELLYGLLAEFNHRYGKDHFAMSQLTDLEYLEHLIPETTLGITPPAQAMPDEFKQSDPVAAYRTYYRDDKATNDWFKYERGTPAPEFLK